MKIGNWIKELRIKQNLKQKHYAEIINCTLEDFILIEKNKKELTSSQLARVLKFSGLTREDLNKDINELKITEFHIDGDIDKAIESTILLNTFLDNFKKVIELNEKNDTIIENIIYYKMRKQLNVIFDFNIYIFSGIFNISEILESIFINVEYNYTRSYSVY